MPARTRTAPFVTYPMHPSARPIWAWTSPNSAPNPGLLSMSSKTITRGAGMVARYSHQSSRSWYQYRAVGADIVRIRPAAAEPTLGGRLGDRHRTEISLTPSLRSLTSSRSMALDTVRASRVRSCSRTPGATCLIVWSVVTTAGGGGDYRGRAFLGGADGTAQGVGGRV